MKCRIIDADRKQKFCSKCGHDTFRVSKGRTKYTNEEKTEGIYYDTQACDNCNDIRRYNERGFRRIITSEVMKK